MSGYSSQLADVISNSLVAVVLQPRGVLVGLNELSYTSVVDLTERSGSDSRIYLSPRFEMSKFRRSGLYSGDQKCSCDNRVLVGLVALVSGLVACPNVRVAE